MPDLNGDVEALIGSETVRADIKCKKIVDDKCAPSNLGDCVMDIGLQAGFQNSQPILVNNETEAHLNMEKVCLVTTVISLSSDQCLGSNDDDGPFILPQIPTLLAKKLATPTKPVNSPILKVKKFVFNRINIPINENLECLFESSVRYGKKKGGSIDKEDSSDSRKIRKIDGVQDINVANIGRMRKVALARELNGKVWVNSKGRQELGVLVATEAVQIGMRQRRTASRGWLSRVGWCH
ncbi:hypothetical protein LWI29_031981 [Acer saccharum]|uniref:Uncharacterized protein n=1 Tax=Acer saccharum TaxID=4024 RepID=A0AA39VF05_ACESA|nr:hypothetical protein LWI29_031981 [Acer saccharum]